MSIAHRFLGFAFAAADLLVEVTPEGRIAFAMGAGEALIGVSDAAMVGRLWTDLIDRSDQSTTQALFCSLKDGARAGPVVIKINSPDGGPERFANVTAMRLPQNQRAVSCVLSKAHARGPSGVQSRESFEARATALAAQAPHELEMAFIELAGLSSTALALTDPDGLQEMLSGILRSQAYQGEAPTAVGGDRYALVRDSREPTEVMAERVGRILVDQGIDGVTPETLAISMTGETQPRKIIKALRYALDLVMQEGLSRPLPGDLGAALDKAMQTTMRKAGALGAAIRHRRFTLAYQPVVDLHDGTLHHHEVLVRFGADSSPFPPSGWLRRWISSSHWTAPSSKKRWPSCAATRRLFWP